MDVSRMHRAVVTLREAVMFTVTMGRSLSVLSLVAAAAIASNAGAQVIISTDASGIARGTVTALSRRAITIADDSVRSYLARYEPGVLDDASGDANIVTMVLDNDGAYIRSSSRHAKVVEGVPGRLIAINGDSARAVTVATSIEPSAVPTVGSVTLLRRSDGEPAGGSLAGVSTDEIGGIATKRYGAGEMGKGLLIVTFVYLK